MRSIFYFPLTKDDFFSRMYGRTPPPQLIRDMSINKFFLRPPWTIEKGGEGTNTSYYIFSVRLQIIWNNKKKYNKIGSSISDVYNDEIPFFE